MFTRYRKFLCGFFAVLIGLVLNCPGNASTFGDVRLAPTLVSSYAATSAPVARAASATDMFVINGSASKTVKILKVFVSYSAAAFTINHFYLIKQSTAGSGGTSSTITACPLDSTNAAASAVVKDYTANRTAGTTVANINIGAQYGMAINGGGAGGSQFALFDADKFGQPIVLRGTSEGLAISNNGVTLAGTTPIAGFTVVWTEE